MAPKTKLIPIELKFNISELVQKSDFIQSKCVNEQWQTKDGVLLNGWWHCVPLKGVEEHYLNPDNWALPEDEISQIQAYSSDLQQYADFMINLMQNEGKRLAKYHVQSVVSFLPPWVTFPLYHASSIGWRMGAGQDYLSAYQKFINSLTEEERKLYETTYPLPCYLAAWRPATEEAKCIT